MVNIHSHSVSLPRSMLIFLLLLLSNISVAQNACSLQRPASQNVVYEQAVSLNTYVQSNTTFFPIRQTPQVAITVTDAPTSFDTITTLSWTKTLPYTLFSSTFSTVTIPTAAESSFILFVTNNELLSKRQTGFYVNSEGIITSDCTNAPVYGIRNGVLTASMNNLVYYYSTDPGVPYSPFIPSLTPGSITTSFSATNKGMLVWFNSEFYNGQAQFCSLANGTVYAVFQQDAAPAGCLIIQLNLFSATSCGSFAFSSGPS